MYFEYSAVGVLEILECVFNKSKMGFLLLFPLVYVRKFL